MKNFFLSALLFLYSTHSNGKPFILTGSAPVASLIASLAGDRAEVEILGSGAQCPHDYKIRPGDSAKIKKADLLIYIDPSFDTSLYKASNILEPSKVICLSSSVSLDIEKNPHFWMDLKKTEKFLKALGGILVEKFPAIKKEIYLNLADSLERIKKLRRDKEDKLSPISDFIILSDSLEYLPDPQKHKIYLLYDSGKSLKYPAKLEKLIKNSKNPCVLTSDPKEMELSLKFGAETVPLEGENWDEIEPDAFFKKYGEIIERIYKTCGKHRALIKY